MRFLSGGRHVSDREPLLQPADCSARRTLLTELASGVVSHRLLVMRLNPIFSNLPVHLCAKTLPLCLCTEYSTSLIQRTSVSEPRQKNSPSPRSTRVTKFGDPMRDQISHPRKVSRREDESWQRERYKVSFGRSQRLKVLRTLQEKQIIIVWRHTSGDQQRH